MTLRGGQNILDIQRGMMNSEPVPLDKIPMGARGNIIDMEMMRESMPQNFNNLQPQRIQVRRINDEGQLGTITHPMYNASVQERNLSENQTYVVGESQSTVTSQPEEQTYVIQHTIKPEDVTFGSPRATPVQDSSASLAFGPRMQDDVEDKVIPDVDSYVPQPQPAAKPQATTKSRPTKQSKPSMNSIDAKVKESIIKIIAKDMRSQIRAQFEERGKDASDQKVENELRAWYWGVGFEDMIVNDRDVKLIVQRPNRFIGKNNYLFYIRAVLAKFGYKLSLVKATPNEIYKAFFGEGA